MNAVSFEDRHKFYKKALKEFRINVYFYKNVTFALPYKECDENNFPRISVSTKGDWFMFHISFDRCNFRLNDIAQDNAEKMFDNAIGFIEGYKMAIHPRKSKIPKYSIIGPSETWADYPPMHKKYYSDITKRILKSGFMKSYHKKFGS